MKQPLWTPKHPQSTNLWQFMRFVEAKHQEIFTNYQDLYTWSIDEAPHFWQTLCEFFKIEFDAPAEAVLNNSDHMLNAKWFSGAKFNIAEQFLKRRDNHPALVCVSEDGKRTSLSYKALYQATAECAAGLKAIGIQEGDRIAAVMPNTDSTIIAMLAAASLGAIWSSCSPDFGAEAALDRLGQIEPKVLFICDGHQYQGKKHSAAQKIEFLHRAIPSLTQVVVCPNIREKICLEALPKALYWEDFIKPATTCEFASLPFSQPLYILFSSGTTGKPKCIIHSAGGTFLQHIKELGLHSNLTAEDIFCFYTTCGWMMWNWMVSGLALGATLILYEGSPTYPKSDRMFQLIEEEQISIFGTSAKFLSAVEQAGVKPNHNYALSSLQCLLSTGSPLLPASYDFVYQHIKADLQLSSMSGGTDIISCFALGNPLLPVYQGELQSIGLGMKVEVFDEEGNSITEQKGELVCTAPFPSMPLGFWQDPDKKAYNKAYFSRFPGIWAHGDFAEITAHQGLIIYGRSDAVLNPGGVRIGTAEIYRQIEHIEGIKESVVIGQEWEGDVRVVLFVSMKEGVMLDEAFIQHIKNTIRHHASPRHVPAIILQVEDIPRTMNGKIAELTVKQVVHKLPVNNLHSLANPDSLKYFQDRDELG